MKHDYRLQFFFFIFFLSSAAHATTTITGGNVINQHWTQAGSPYMIQGDLVVPVGSTLRIDPGVVVQAASSDGLAGGRDASRIEITIHGSLIAQGTKTEPIHFTSQISSMGAWYGLVFEFENTASHLQHVVIQNPTIGVLLNAPSSSVGVRNVTVERASQRGVYALSGSHHLDSIIVRSSITGIYVDTAGALQLTNCLIHGNANAGLQVYQAVTAPASVTVTNCTFHGNGSSNIRLQGVTADAPAVSISNTIITGSSRYGIENINISSVTVNFCNIWNNSSGNTIGISAGIGNVSYNPLYISSTDFQVSSGSLVIDAGDPTTLLAHDIVGAFRPLDGDGLNGARVDMGAYEFILSPACGDGVLQIGEVCDDGPENGEYGSSCNATCTGIGPHCGDGIRDSTQEACDDGNLEDTDACLSNCTVAICGDGLVHAGVEACDDGNSDDTDACLSDCVLATCGDGHVWAGYEECDDGNDVFNDGCTQACELTNCGNGSTDPGEECDDGNSSEEDACMNDCTSARCGDGRVQTGIEDCDDGNDVNQDECTNSCELPRCGDGIVQTGEICDDGDEDEGNACLNNCRPASCGDGHLQVVVEACDDGNLLEGDGCNALCQVEETQNPSKKNDGWSCSTGPHRSGRPLPASLMVLALIAAMYRRRDQHD